MDGVAELAIDHCVLYPPVLVDAEIVEPVDSPARNTVAQAYAHMMLVSVGISRFERMVRHRGVKESVTGTKGKWISRWRKSEKIEMTKNGLRLPDHSGRDLARPLIREIPHLAAL